MNNYEPCDMCGMPATASITQTGGTGFFCTDHLFQGVALATRLEAFHNDMDLSSGMVANLTESAQREVAAFLSREIDNGREER